MAGEHDPKSAGVTRPGAKIFHNFCSVCHGDKGDGQSRARNSFAVPPRSFTTPDAAIELTRERMIHSVTDGRAGTAMIPWRTELTAAEIEGVVDYMRATFMHLENNKTAARKRPDSKLLASRGGILYMQACAMCHGDTGKRATSGGMKPPPQDFTSPKAAAELTRKRMIASVTNGRTDTAMRGYATQFSQSDIEAIVDFISAAYMPVSASRQPPAPKVPALETPEKSAAINAAPTPVVADMSLPMPQGLKGDLTKGRNFFMQNCYTCHGVTGAGDGPRAYFINPKPRNFLLETSRKYLNRPALFKTISKGISGSEMPAWNKVLNDQEIADVAEYVFQSFIMASQGGKGTGSGGK